MTTHWVRAATSTSIALLAVGGALTIASGSRRDAEREFVYIQNLSHDRVVIAWGGPTDDGGNTIGETSTSFGPATIRVFDGTTGEPIPGSPFSTSTRNWLEIRLPHPSHGYSYDLQVAGEPWGDPVYRDQELFRFRSLPAPGEPSPPLAFLVIGDFGTGDDEQFALAEAMVHVPPVGERKRRRGVLRKILRSLSTAPVSGAFLPDPRKPRWQREGAARRSGPLP